MTESILSEFLGIVILKRFIKPLLWIFLSVLLIAGMMAALVALMEHKSGARPDVKLQTLNGEVITLDEVADNKPMLVNLWATWCPPCIREMPMLLQAQKANPGISFVFVNQGEHTETVKNFLTDSDLDLANVLLDSKGQLAQVTASMALPTTLLYNAKGEQVGLHRSELSPEQLDEILKSLQP